MSESAIQRAIRVRLGQLRLPFLRYQVGTFLTRNGSPIHIGEKGVSDLIGITPHVVTLEDVGRTIGVFTALEIKKPKGSRTAEHQSAFLRAVNRLGGLGAIVKSPEDAEAVVREKWNAKIVIDCSSKDE
jgi:hypothetical protein